MVPQLSTEEPMTAENGYNPELKIWSGAPRKVMFNESLSIGEIIFETMSSNPEHVAQISVAEGTSLTYREVQQNAMRVASYLRSVGVGQKENVGLIGRQTTHMAAVAYGCFFNGSPIHCLHKSYELVTIEKLYGLTRPKVIFCDGDEYEKVKEATAKLDVKVITMRNHKPGSIPIETILETQIENKFQPTHLELGSNHTLAILCSSGTTGTPKAVTISNSHLIIPYDVDIPSGSVQYAFSTMDWISGLILIIVAGIFSTTRIVAADEFDPGFVCHLIEKYKVNFFFASSPDAAKLCNSKEFETADLSSLEHFFYGGAHCSSDVQERIRHRIGRNILHFCYAMTELNANASYNFDYDGKPKSVGRLSAGIKVKLRDKNGNLCGPNKVGEICLLNGQHWSGYYGNPVESATVKDADHWFHSGDLGYLDEDGYLFVIDRIKDMLKYENHMFYPNEIEEVIAEIPDVVEACVFGIIRAEVGEEAAASVVIREESTLKAQDVLDFVEKRIQAKYKQLYGGVLIVEDLMRCGNGKTNRRATKAHFLKVTNTREDI
ncbi:uncharacterized protein [Drosophila bipectinata]|uniref:uncharacterized protein n=1 Tax=Drosophila bipectinata TaxID=42026 RepID=UPI0038B3E7C3